MDNIYNENAEVREAIIAGEKALVSLNEAKSCLSSAKKWGWFDMFSGGGIFPSMLKHIRIDAAAEAMERAKRDLSFFKEELGDIKDSYLIVDVGSFLTFADIFLDNVFVDYIVQKRIKNAKEQVEDAIYQTENILARLRSIN